MICTYNNTSFEVNHILARQLDSLIYNIRNDWDFVILITGDRRVRVGKSVLGIQVCSYLAKRMQDAGINTTYSLDDVYFDSQKMLHEAINKPKYSINHYDEGREGLAASKYMQQFQRDLLDFYAECGQLNQIFVIVLPDYFELKEEIAVARSEMLLNVYVKESIRQVNVFGSGPQEVYKIERGFFEFFDRKKKSYLHDMAKSRKQKNYNLVKPNFTGTFSNIYPLDEDKYKAMKRDSLVRFAERKEAESKQKPNMERNKWIAAMAKEGIDSTKISNILSNAEIDNLSRGQVRRIMVREADV